MQLPYIGSARGLDARPMVDRDLEWIAPFAGRPDNLVRCQDPIDASFVASLASALVVEEWNERHPGRLIPRGVRMVRTDPSDATVVEIVHLCANDQDLERWMLRCWSLPETVRVIRVRADRLRDDALAKESGFRDDPGCPGFLTRSSRA